MEVQLYWEGRYFADSYYPAKWWHSREGINPVVGYDIGNDQPKRKKRKNKRSERLKKMSAQFESELIIILNMLEE